MPVIAKEDRLSKIAERLLEKTRHGELSWKKHDSTSFRTTIGPDGVAIHHDLLHGDADTLRLLFLGNGSEVAGDWEVHEDEPGWHLLSMLFEEARGSALGFDKILQNIEAHLEK